MLVNEKYIYTSLIWIQSISELLGSQPEIYLQHLRLQHSKEIVLEPQWNYENVDYSGSKVLYQSSSNDDLSVTSSNDQPL